MSIIDTLVTDRLQSDVDALNDKGTYNATDLNRVQSACEYIAERLSNYGYSVSLKQVKAHPVVTLTNLIPNGSFEQDADWSGVVYDSAQAYQGLRSSELGPGTVVTTSSQVTTPVVGHKYYGRSWIKSQGDIQPADCRFELYAGDGAGLNFVFAWNQGNFPDWTMRSTILTVDAVNGTSYIVRNFVVGAVNPCWTDCLMIIDLTAAFGVGNEPDQAWCDENIPYFDGSMSYTLPDWWLPTDIPVQSQMEDYLANVQTLRDTIEVLQSTPQVPESMALLDWVGANNIEQILVDLETVINRTFMSFLRSGQFTFWSGYRPLPAAESYMGRTWAELDAMNTTWANWQVADWYLLLYGNLEAEGVVT